MLRMFSIVSIDFFKFSYNFITEISELIKQYVTVFVFEKNDGKHIHCCEYILLWFYIIYDNIYLFHVIASEDNTSFENETDAD